MKPLVALILALFACISISFAAINVNTATDAELQMLNGIGPVKAKAIPDHRSKHGPFKSVEELDNVPGIGQGTFAKIRNDVMLTGATSVAAETKGTAKKGASVAKRSEQSAERGEGRKKEPGPAMTPKRETKGDKVTREKTMANSNKKAEGAKGAQDNKVYKKNAKDDKGEKTSIDDSATADPTRKEGRSKKDSQKSESVK